MDRCEKCVHFPVCSKKTEAAESCDFEVPLSIASELFTNEGIYHDLDGKFDKIKEAARSRVLLPKDFAADKIDRDYHASMLKLFENHRAKIISHEEAMEEGKRYRNKYISDKAVNISYVNACKAAHDKRLKTGQTSALLIKGQRLSFKKTVDLLFLLLEQSLDGVTARAIKRSIYLTLASAERKYTKEELKEIRELRKND